jgi:NTP pyrophosphatase (non-canonical NTP hydrolase)
VTFEEYQKKAIATDVWRDRDVPSPVPLTHPAFLDKVLGLLGESGEVAEKLKKILRDKGATLTDHDRQELAKELGDILWYVAVVGHYLGVSLESVAAGNIQKLASREHRGQLGGQGDNR